MREKELIREFLKKYIKVENMEDDTNIFESGLANSLFAIQLVNWVEDEFDISITNEQLDLENFKSINAIANLISRNM